MIAWAVLITLCCTIASEHGLCACRRTTILISASGAWWSTWERFSRNYSCPCPLHIESLLKLVIRLANLGESHVFQVRSILKLLLKTNVILLLFYYEITIIQCLTAFLSLGKRSSSLSLIRWLRILISWIDSRCWANTIYYWSNLCLC